MLRNLPDDPAVRRTLDEISEYLHADVRELDSAEALQSTVSVQLALLASGVAVARALFEEGVKPEAVAGLSVGAFAAAVAAGAEAQLTGKLAACGGSCGPGNLHLINGLFDAHRSNAPVLAIASHIPTSEIGTGYFQETHPQNLFQECSHYCELISNPAQFERVLHIAMQNALGKGGVSVIVLPGDVGGADLPAEGSPRSLVTKRPSIRPSEKDLARLADLINSSKKVALFCGIGCENAHDEVVALAEKVKAPVGHT